MSDRPLRVALWCAVSSRPQASDDKTSLDDQRIAGEQFAAAINGNVVTRYSVPGHSRDYVLWQDAEAAIPAYRDLRADCDRRAFDVLHAVDADRLGRTAALIHQVIGLVEAAGAEVYLASSPHTVGQATIAQRYVSAIQAVRAEEDQTIRVARHERGMRGRVRRGLHAGTWPYGYTVVRDASGACVGAELVPEEAATVHHVTRLFLAGTSYREIARALNDGGFPTRDDATEWYGTKVRRLMFNDTYAGYPRWRKARPDDVSTKYTSLWDVSTFAAVMDERRSRGSRQYHATPLLDVAFCARCGGRMTRQVLELAAGPACYLRCGRHAHSADCHTNSVPESTVQDAVTDYLADRLADADAIERLAVSRAGPQAGLERDLADLDARAEDIAERRQRIALALAAGQMDAQMYRQVDDTLLDELDGVNAAHQSVEAQLVAVPDAAQQVVTMTRLVEALDSLWDRPVREVASLLQRAGV
ncbi:MAG TPA: recombinase family protein, partial [Phycisphaerae bacterium]|nr:recombinase family protein [Phycisphaerae bacterium]